MPSSNPTGLGNATRYVINRLVLQPLGIYSDDELRSWVPYRPWLSTVCLEGVTYSDDHYRFEKRKIDGKFEYRAIPLTPEEIEDRRVW